MGDAAHTAHFSIGSGTKLALEDAIELARSIGQHPGDLDAALTHYEELRSVEVLKIQNAARNSTEWFEHVDRYVNLPPEQFAYSLLTRSQRISHENLRLRDKGYVESYEDWIAAAAGRQRVAPHGPIPPMLTPFTLRGVTLKNRIVVSPMAQYSAVDGIAGDYHLVHLGARAMGGAAMVVAEMTCPTATRASRPAARACGTRRSATPGSASSTSSTPTATPRSRCSSATPAPRARPGVPWEGEDLPLESGNWPLISASPQQYLDGVSDWSEAMTRADMDRVTRRLRPLDALRRRGRLRLARAALRPRLPAVVVHLAAHQPAHRRYGGSLENRLRYPLEVFQAVREVWPKQLPISVRISAHDWVEGGITPDDAVEIARHFKAAGADMIDCSSGQVSKLQKPVYGRMYQAPFADRIRNEAGIPTIAVGAISEADHVNSIIAAGRADLCAIARPHLANPAWTLLESARIGYTEVEWPKQYRSAKTQLERNLERERQMAAAQGGGLSALEQANKALGV